MILFVSAFFISILAYVVGSVPGGLIMSYLTNSGDLRQNGSGNIGATNALRTAGWKLALPTLLFDLAKGYVAVSIALTIGGPEPLLAGLAALFSILGHCFPVWINFKGGKGVATGIGALLALNPFIGIMTASIWLVAALIWRYSSLAALASFALAPIFAFLAREEMSIVITLFLIMALIFKRHQNNISRLQQGLEPKIGQKT